MPDAVNALSLYVQLGIYLVNRQLGKQFPSNEGKQTKTHFGWGHSEFNVWPDQDTGRI
jgi:hypothetical protein